MDDVVLNKAATIELLAERMLAMVGFRNVAVHDYRRLDLDIVAAIAGSHVDEFLDFARTMVTLEAVK